jgi:DNA-binding CsgD family transcriptional regulator/tetratricopeptide (TPR) repeat protein
MLETAREFAAERLTTSGEDATVRARYAAYFLDLAEQAEPALKGPDQVSWWRRLETEQANLRTALTRLIERADGEGALRLTGALAWYWWTRGNPGEGRDWLERALALCADAPPAVRAKALCGLCPLAGEQGDYQRAFAYAEEALALSGAIGDEAGSANALRMLAVAAHDKGDHGRAVPLYEICLAHYRGVHNRWGIASVVVNLGRIACFQGDYDRATVLLNEGLTLSRQAGDTHGTAGSLWTLAELTRRQGKHDVAAAHYRESLALRWKRGDRRLLPECLRGLARTAAATSDPVRAARLGGAEEALREAIAIPLNPPLERARYEVDIGEVRVLLGEHAFATAWAAGRALPLERAVTEALAPINVVPSPANAASAVDPSGHHGLTLREIEVLRLLAVDRSNPEIGEALFISPRTAQTHVTNIFAKLGVATRAEAAAVAVRERLV